MVVFSIDTLDQDVQNEVLKLEFNFNVKIGWDGNNWFIEGYEWTFSNLNEVREFCRRYL